MHTDLTPGIWEYNIANNTLFVCSITKELLGIETDIDLDTLSALFTNNKKKDFATLVKTSIDDNTSFQAELFVAQSQKKVVINGRTDRKGYVIGTFQKHTPPIHVSEKNIQFSENQFGRAFKYSAIGMALVSPDGKWLKVNKQLTKIIGYTKKEIINLSFQDITHPEDLNLDLSYVKKMLNGEIESYQMEKRYFHKNGNIIWAQLNVSLIWNKDNTPLYFISQIQDITEYKRTVSNLKKQQLRLEGFLEGTNLGTWEWHIPTGKIALNERCNNIVGFAPDELNAHHISVWEDMLHPEDYHRAMQAHEECFTKKKPFLDVIYRLKHKTGKYIWIRDRGKVIEWSEDSIEPIIMSGTLADITEEIKRENEIIKDKEFLHSIVSAIPDLIFRFDKKNHFTYCHTNNPENLAIRPEDFLGKRIRDVFPVEFATLVENFLKKAFDSSEVELLEYELEVPQGVNYFEARSSKINKEEVLIIIRDITQRKKSEFLLKQSEAQLTSIISVMQEGVAMHNQNGEITLCNRSSEKILGLTREQILGKNSIDPSWKTFHLDGSPFPGEEHPAIISLKTGKKITNVVMGVQKNKNDLSWISINSAPLINEGEETPYASIATFHDITERKNAEIKLKKLYELMALTGNDIDQNMSRVLDEGCKILEMDLGIIAMIKGNEYKVVYHYNFDNVDLTGQVFEFENTYCEITYRHNQLTAIENMGKSIHNGHPCYEIFKLESYIGVPLTVNNKRYGTLNFSSSKIRTNIFASIDQDFLLLLAKWVSSMLEMKEAKIQLQINEKKYRAFYELSPVGIALYKLENNLLVNTNATFLKMIDYDTIDKTNLHLNDVLDLSNEIELKKNREKLIQTGKCGPFETAIINSKKQRIPVILNSVLLNDESGEKSVFSVIHDISERKRSEEKYRNVIAGINIGMLEINDNNEISFANENFCEMSGYDSSELIGLKIYDFYIKCKVRLVENIAISDSNGDQIWIKNKKGELRCWLTNRVPNYVREELKIGVIGIYLDITEQKKLEQELEIAKIKAEESSKAKEVFLTNMSHEIRTPLNAIMGMNRALKQLPLNELATSYVKNTERASEHLLSIISNILDISKIESGEFQLDNDHFDLQYEIESVIDIMKIKANEKELDLNHHINLENQKVYLGDNTVIRQILINLIGNAIKFTNRGNIKIECRSKPIENNFHEIFITISDTGIGMDEDYLNSVFNKFSQEDKTIARKFGGTGLGMAITYELIQLLEGSITIKSKKKKGTVVSIIFKLPLGNNDVVFRRSTTTDTSILNGKNILLVEDNEMNRLVANNTLSHYNCIIDEAENGLKAIEMIKKHSYDIILMDIQMPVLDGIVATNIIRNELNIQTPIIALTANAFKSEIENCLSIGMNDYITKPFEEQTFINIIINAILHEEENLTIEQKRQSPMYNLDKLYQTSKGDQAFIKKMLSLFIEQTPLAIEKIKTAFTENDLLTLKSTSHRIKPTLEFLKIESVSDIIRDLEQNNNLFDPKTRKQIDELEIILNKVIYELKKQYPMNNS